MDRQTFFWTSFFPKQLICRDVVSIKTIRYWRRCYDNVMICNRNPEFAFIHRNRVDCIWQDFYHTNRIYLMSFSCTLTDRTIFTDHPVYICIIASSQAHIYWWKVLIRLQIHVRINHTHTHTHTRTRTRARTRARATQRSPLWSFLCPLETGYQTSQTSKTK